MKLSKLCHKRLESAEKKIEILVKKEGKKLERRRVDEPGESGEALSLLDEAE